MVYMLINSRYESRKSVHKVESDTRNGFSFKCLADDGSVRQSTHNAVRKCSLRNHVSALGRANHVACTVQHRYSSGTADTADTADFYSSRSPYSSDRAAIEPPTKSKTQEQGTDKHNPVSNLESSRLLSTIEQTQ
jgi:hypothetical protein